MQKSLNNFDVFVVMLANASEFSVKLFNELLVNVL